MSGGPDGSVPRARQARWQFVGVVLLAGLGAFLLAVIVALYWTAPGDNLAYWIAGSRLAHGLPIYAPPEIAFEPFAYHYPPPLAQALAPVTLVVPALAYAVAYRGFLLLCLWHLAGRTMLRTLALIAFVPVAMALRFENVELFMAVAIVLGLGRWPWLFSILALVKASPGLGLVYLALRRRWGDALVSGAVGAAIVGVSLALAPDLWPAWLDSIAGRAGMVGNSIVPVPYAFRAVAGLVLAVVAGAIGRRPGEMLLVAAVTIANPGLSLQGFAVLAVWVPIWAAGPGGLGSTHEPVRRPGERKMSPA